MSATNPKAHVTFNVPIGSVQHLIKFVEHFGDLGDNPNASLTGIVYDDAGAAEQPAPTQGETVLGQSLRNELDDIVDKMEGGGRPRTIGDAINRLEENFKTEYDFGHEAGTEADKPKPAAPPKPDDFEDHMTRLGLTAEKMSYWRNSPMYSSLRSFYRVNCSPFKASRTARGAFLDQIMVCAILERIGPMFQSINERHVSQHTAHIHVVIDRLRSDIAELQQVLYHMSPDAHHGRPIGSGATGQVPTANRP